MNGNIKGWYQSAYPDDDMGVEINEDISFALLELALNRKMDVYEVLGDRIDSVIRERVFEELAKRKGVEYKVIYDLWMEGV